MCLGIFLASVQDGHDLDVSCFELCDVIDDMTQVIGRRGAPGDGEHGCLVRLVLMPRTQTSRLREREVVLSWPFSLAASFSRISAIA